MELHANEKRARMRKFVLSPTRRIDDCINYTRFNCYSDLFV